MDHQWAAKKLTEFVNLILKVEHDNRELQRLEDEFDDDEEVIIELNRDIRQQEIQIQIQEPGMQVIMEAAAKGLGDYREPVGDGRRIFVGSKWEPARAAALRAIGLHTFGAEAEEKMRPAAPDVAADEFHPWVWDSARPMWEAGSLQSALQHASSSINVRLKQKLDRHDVSDRRLCAEAFSFDPPAPGKPRLRFPGNRDTETWKALQGGASSFGQGCFTAIRNPVSHDHEHPVTQQEALEQLGALSVFARWIDICEVETVD